jgi:hypothetical protein
MPAEMRVSDSGNFRISRRIGFYFFPGSKNRAAVMIPQQDSAVRAFNKLARTFAAQVETLKRHRGGGEQVQVGSILRRAALR